MADIESGSDFEDGKQEVDLMFELENFHNELLGRPLKTLGASKQATEMNRTNNDVRR